MMNATPGGRRVRAVCWGMVLAPASALGAGPMDRLKGVSEHAKSRVSGGPEHLWVGVALFLVLGLAVGAAVWWMARKGKR